MHDSSGRGSAWNLKGNPYVVGLYIEPLRYKTTIQYGYSAGSVVLTSSLKRGKKLSFFMRIS